MSKLGFDGFQHRVEIERLFKGLMGAKQFGDLQKVSITLRPSHGNDFGVQIFARQLQGGFQPIDFRHQQIHDE